jgi:hypothetical protein
MSVQGYSLNNFRPANESTVYEFLSGIHEELFTQKPGKEKEKSPVGRVWSQTKHNFKKLKREAETEAEIRLGSKEYGQFQQKLTMAANKLKTSLAEGGSDPLNQAHELVKYAHSITKVSEIVFGVLTLLALGAIVVSIISLEGNIEVSDIAGLAAGALLTGGLVFLVVQLNAMRRAAKTAEDEIKKMMQSNPFEGCDVTVSDEKNKKFLIHVTDLETVKNSIGRVIEAIDRMPINPLKWFLAGGMMTRFIKTEVTRDLFAEVVNTRIDGEDA